MNEKINNFMKKCATVILAYADYESFELALAAHAKFLSQQQKLFILQNGRDTYDCDRTYEVALRYRDLYPKQIEVIDTIQPGKPYLSLKKLFQSEKFSEFDYIIKLDDDVLPLTHTWFPDLCKCYIDSYEKYGDDLAYVTSLINNNPYGFKKTLEIMGYWQEYQSRYAREHLVGYSAYDSYAPYRLLPKEKISTGGCGTIWRYPYIARFIHQKTTLNADAFISATSKLGYENVNHRERYSINCILFKKNMWDDIDIGQLDDEHMWHAYCMRKNKKIVANLAVPMVHLFFYSQRRENRNMIDEFRNYFSKWLDHPYPISICPDRTIELENRLRYLEERILNKKTTSDKIRRKLKSFEKILFIGNERERKVVRLFGLEIFSKKK